MRIIAGLIALVLTACSIPRAPDSTAFFKREAAAVEICTASLKNMPAEAIYSVDQSTGISPTTKSAHCYQKEMRWVVASLNYPHSAQVEAFTSRLVNLAELRDKGAIDTPTALAAYKSTKEEFRESLARADEQINAAGSRELIRRLGVASGQMANTLNQQNAVNAPRAPTLCSYETYRGSTTTFCN